MDPAVIVASVREVIAVVRWEMPRRVLDRSNPSSAAVLGVVEETPLLRHKAFTNARSRMSWTQVKGHSPVEEIAVKLFCDGRNP